MSTLAIIPARGGSKGIKDKNLANVNGKPLIYYSLKACFECKKIKKVIVTTDSKKISRTVLKFFPKTIIIKRPKKISLDKSISEEALLHAIKSTNYIKNIKKILFVQATSPLSTKSDFKKLISKLDTSDSAFFFTYDYGHFYKINDLTKPRVPRQKRKPLKREAGNAWAFKKDGFLKHKSRLFGKIGSVKIDHLKTYEIDEAEDLLFVNYLIKKLKSADN